MPLIQPFAALKPTQDYVDAVVAPPYDVLNTAEAREKAQHKPWSFLHISKPEIDLAPEISPYDPAVYAKGAENLQKMLDQGILAQDDQAYYYVYQLTMGDHTQTGLVAVASVAEYETNRIRKHELTRPQKEEDRVNQILALETQTGPVFLVYRQHEIVDKILQQTTTSNPLMKTTADDGVIHTIWRMTDAQQQQQITDSFEQMTAIYIADGHHRSAAALRVAKHYRAMATDNNTESAYDYFLSVIFPDNEMQILDYNRVITDLSGLSIAEFQQKVAENFDISPLSTPQKPTQAHCYSMYLQNQWYQLRLKPELIPADPVAKLDVSLLANYLLEPILNITDPRRDSRIDFVGGIRGLVALEKRAGETGVAFALYPTQMQDLIAVADANQIMPPKSTWFEPKLADGLLSHRLK